MKNKYCDKCGSAFVCSCDGKSYIPGGFRYNSCWPTLTNGKNKPITETRLSWADPNMKTPFAGWALIMLDTIPQLLDQAEQVRNARRPDRRWPTLLTWISETIDDVNFHLWRFDQIAAENPKGDYGNA